MWGVEDQPSFQKSCEILYIYIYIYINVYIYTHITRVPNFRIRMGLHVYRITSVMKSEATSITLMDRGTSNCASGSSAPLVSCLVGGWNDEEQDTTGNRMGEDRLGNRRTTMVKV